MLRKLMVISLTLAFAPVIAEAANTPSMRVDLSATDIVAKNVQARGGLQAWRSVHSLSWTGKLGAGGNQRAPLPQPVPGKNAGKLPVIARPTEEVQLPFVMDLQRPRKERFELQFNGQTAVQVFDGVNGWKLRPYLNRREVEPFTADELKAASMQPDLDGPLVDYAAKGTKVELEGIEKVEDHDAYKLKLTMKDGHSTQLWIDAQTFLETKIEGQPRRLDGKLHPVQVYYRDYRAVNGLQIPFLLETKVLPLADNTAKVREIPVPSEKIVIEKVVVNPNLEETLFSKPAIQSASIRH